MNLYRSQETFFASGDFEPAVVMAMFGLVGCGCIISKIPFWLGGGWIAITFTAYLYLLVKRWNRIQTFEEKFERCYQARRGAE